MMTSTPRGAFRAGSRITTALAVAWSLALHPPRAAAMEPGGGSPDGDTTAASAPAPARRRVMQPQPRFGEITLLDSHGRTVALQDAVTAEVPVLVNFIFTSCPSICPVMSRGFAHIEDRLRAEHRPVRLVSISIDPEVDTPARLQQYATRLSAGQDWWLLTGTPAAVEAAQRAFGAYRGGKYNHVPATYVRRAATAPWEQLDGLASGELLLRAYGGF